MAVPAIISLVGIPVATAIGTRIASAIRGGQGRQAVTTEEILLAQGVDPGGLLPTFRPGAAIEIEGQGLAPGTQFKVDPVSGELVIVKRRRRRKRLLTCSDKADIAFLTGTLGKGALAQGAITSVLSKCG